MVPLSVYQILLPKFLSVIWGPIGAVADNHLHMSSSWNRDTPQMPQVSQLLWKCARGGFSTRWIQHRHQIWSLTTPGIKDLIFGVNSIILNNTTLSITLFLAYSQWRTRFGGVVQARWRHTYRAHHMCIDRTMFGKSYTHHFVTCQCEEDPVNLCVSFQIHSLRFDN